MHVYGMLLAAIQSFCMSDTMPPLTPHTSFVSLVWS